MWEELDRVFLAQNPEVRERMWRRYHKEGRLDAEGA